MKAPDLLPALFITWGVVLVALVAALVFIVWRAERREARRLRRQARRAAQAYGLHLLPTDEVGRARDRRQGRGAA